MPIHIRALSLALRRRQSAKEGERILRHFWQWQQPQRELPEARPVAGTLLLVRLDDIGDYLLFRNQLALYKRAPRWAGRRITLLGNQSWRELFTAFDRDAVDEVIWVDKGRYLASADYRWEIWQALRQRGFETVIAASRTRPLILDDLCVLAAAPRHTLGCENTYIHPRWNSVSDGFYETLFRPTEAMRRLHEFQFNGEFTTWACGSRYLGTRPRIDGAITAPSSDSYLLCFVGANTRSKRWPAARWVEFIELYHRQHGGAVILAGNSTAELRTVKSIQARTAARSIAGQVSLLELASWIAHARAVVSNDTMAAHLGVSFSRPTVIVANGVNYQRFTDYASAGIDAVATLYPDVFLRKRRRVPSLVYNYPDALSADIASIDGHRVFDELQNLMA